jgi:hypothetical protein
MCASMDGVASTYRIHRDFRKLGIDGKVSLLEPTYQEMATTGRTADV